LLGTLAASGKGRHVVCPFEAEPTKVGGEGTFVINASDGAGFVIKCQHDACTGRDRLDHLAAMVANESIPNAALTNPAFVLPSLDDPIVVSPALVQERIKALAKGDLAGRSEVIEAIAGVPSEGDREALIMALRDKTGIKVSLLRREVDDARPAETVERGEGHVVESDGHRVLTHTGGKPDQRVATAFLLETMLAENAKGLPAWTSNLGAVMHMREAGGRFVFDAPGQLPFRALLAQRCSFAKLPDKPDTPMKLDLPKEDLCSVVMRCPSSRPCVGPRW
jgi:hypothetical protein